MASPAVRDILSSLSARVRCLESIADVQVPVISRASLGSQAQECAVAFVDNGNSAAFYNKHFDKMISRCKIWVNSMQPYVRCNSVMVFRELDYREMSNGLPCPNIVVQGLFNYSTGANSVQCDKHEQPVVIKMRSVQPGTEEMTERELQHMVSTSLDERISDLFPKMYFGMIVPDKRNTNWECVGTELLLDPSRSVATVSFYRQAYKLLCMLHKAGYCHGDSHRRNFMRIPPESDHKKYTSDGILFIDQDSMEALPTQKDMHAVTMLMVIRDFIILLYQMNPSLNLFEIAFTYRNKADADRIAHALYYKTEYKSIFRPPWHYVVLREKSSNMLELMLNEFPEYKQFLDGITLDNIHNQFRTVFVENFIGMMEKMTTQFTQWLVESGLRPSA